MVETRRRALGAAIVLALVVAACGGSASPAPTAAPSAAPASEAPTVAPTQEPTEAPTVAPTEAPTAAPSEAVTPPIDISGLTGKTSQLSAYELDLKMSGFGGMGEITLTHKFQTVPVKAQSFDMSVAGQETSMIVIEGQGAWQKVGTAWVEIPGDPTTITASFAQLAPDVLVSSMNLDQFGAALFLKGEETRNGVQALHYAIDASKLGSLPAASSFPPDAKVDIWSAKDGNYLVAMEFSGTMSQNGVSSKVSMVFDVSRVNDATLTITAPK